MPHVSCPMPHAPDSSPHAARRMPLLCLFLFAIILRLLFAATYIGLDAPPSAEPEPDAPQYEEIARNLLEKGEFVQHLNGMTYYAYRSPLWPICIAGVHRVFGPSRVAVRLFTIILGGLVPLLLFFIALRLGFSQRVAWMAGIYAACYPFFILYSALHLTEALFITLLYATILAALRMVDELTAASALMTGIMVGLTALTRPVVYPLPALIGLALLLRHGFRRRLVVPLLILGVSAILVTAPWFLRNLHVLGALIPGDTHGGNTFYGAYNPGLFNRPDLVGSWYLPPQDDLPPEYRYDPRSDGELDQDKAYWALGKKFIAEHPDVLPWFVWRRFVRFFSAWPSGPLYRKLLSLFSYGPMLILSLMGFWLFRSRWREHVLIHLLILQSTMLSLIFVASVRMRNPLDGFLIIFAASAILLLLERRKRPL